MRSGKIALLAGFTILWAMAQLIGTLGGSAVTLLSAVVIGVLGTLGARLFSLAKDPAWLLPVLLGGSAMLGVGTAWLAGRAGAVDSLAVPLALITSFTLMTLQRVSGRRCGLCNKRLSPDILLFNCPRCSLVVCDTTCWNFEHRRCQLCMEHRVALLPAKAEWWDRALGPSAHHGRCQVCMATFEQAELRHCFNCRRLQCTECWDHLNGECARCGWTIADLPASLKFIATSHAAALSSAESDLHG